MPSDTALVAVKRREAKAELVEHRPFPIGHDTRPLNAEQIEALLTSPCEWTQSIPSFLFRNIALQPGGGCYSDLKEVAEREFLSAPFGEETFPFTQFADFLEVAYRSGLLTKNYIAPNGDIHSRIRVAMYEISPNAHELLARHTSAEIEGRAASVPTISEADTSHVREQLSPVIEYLNAHGPSVRDTMLEALTLSTPDGELDAQLERYEALIDQGIELRLLSQQENKLGAYILSVLE
jgi:hypothetical protein